MLIASRDKVDEIAKQLNELLVQLLAQLLAQPMDLVLDAGNLVVSLVNIFCIAHFVICHRVHPSLLRTLQALAQLLPLPPGSKRNSQITTVLMSLRSLFTAAHLDSFV